MSAAHPLLKQHHAKFWTQELTPKMIKGWYPFLVSLWIRAPAIGVPDKTARAVTVPKAPSLAPKFSVSDLWQRASLR